MSPLKRLLLSLAALYRITTASDAPQTISDLPAYSQQRPCATDCFFNGSGQDLLGSAIDCCEVYTDTDCDTPVADACYCRADLRPLAVSWLSLCVDTQCSTNAERPVLNDDSSGESFSLIRRWGRGLQNVSCHLAVS